MKLFRVSGNDVTWIKHLVAKVFNACQLDMLIMGCTSAAKLLLNCFRPRDFAPTESETDMLFCCVIRSMSAEARIDQEKTVMLFRATQASAVSKNTCH